MKQNRKQTVNNRQSNVPDLCTKFLRNPKVNPRTDKPISTGGTTYKKLMAECGKYKEEVNRQNRIQAEARAEIRKQKINALNLPKLANVFSKWPPVKAVPIKLPSGSFKTINTGAGRTQASPSVRPKRSSVSDVVPMTFSEVETLFDNSELLNTGDWDELMKEYNYDELALMNAALGVNAMQEFQVKHAQKWIGKRIVTLSGQWSHQHPNIGFVEENIIERVYKDNDNHWTIDYKHRGPSYYYNWDGTFHTGSGADSVYVFVKPA